MSSILKIKNRKASYEYKLINKYVAGIMLVGTEIKSIRNNQANISDSYCLFIKDDLYVKNLHIAEYQNAGNNNHDTKRNRKLLLNRHELNKIKSKTNEKGMSIIPTLLFINDTGKAKLEIAIAKGKKNYDKRNSLKEKDQKRQVDIEKAKNRL